MLTFKVLVMIIMFEEGFSSGVYKDHLGYDTVGYGFRVYEGDRRQYNKGDAKSELSHRVSRLIYNISRDKVLSKVFFATNKNGRAVMTLMAYQVGVNGLAKFKGFISALESGRILLAKKEMLDSLWAKQTPERARRTARLLDTHYTKIYKGIAR